MGLTEAISSAISNYFNFHGRACRAEYFSFLGFLSIFSVVAILLDVYLFSTPEGPPEIFPLSAIFSLVILVPTIGISVRRLHDIGLSGWWFFVGGIPVVGVFIMAYWIFQPGEARTNAYGSNPLQGIRNVW